MDYCEASQAANSLTGAGAVYQHVLIKLTLIWHHRWSAVVSHVRSVYHYMNCCANPLIVLRACVTTPMASRLRVPEGLQTDSTPVSVILCCEADPVS